MGRTILALVVGFLLVPAIGFGAEILVAHFRPDWYPDGRIEHAGVLLLALGYGGLGLFVGCYVTALIQVQRPLRYALILGVIGLVISVFVNIAQWDTAPAWYHAVSIAMVLPLAWLAGRLYLHRHPPAA